MLLAFDVAAVVAGFCTGAWLRSDIGFTIGRIVVEHRFVCGRAIAYSHLSVVLLVSAIALVGVS